MNRHKFKVNVLKFIYQTENASRHIKGDELKRITDGLRALPINITESCSRYLNPGSSNEHCLIFLDETTIGYRKSSGFLPAVFIHRRGNSRPFEEDGQGNLLTLKLNNTNNELAEVAYILINIENGYCFWTYNPFVGGTNKFTEYVNKKILELSQTDSIKPELYGEIPFFSVAYIVQDNAFDEFNKTKSIRKLEYNITSSPEKLTQFFLTENDDAKGMELFRYFVENSKCGRIGVNLSAEKKKKDKKSKIPIIPSLNKEFIIRLFKQTEILLKENLTNQFNVIDEDAKIIDLLYQRLTYRLVVEYRDEYLPVGEIIDKMISLMKVKYAEIQRYCK